MTILMCWMFDSELLIGDGFSELWIWLVEGVGLRLNVVAEVKVASWWRQGGGLTLSTLRFPFFCAFVVFLWNLGFFKIGIFIYFLFCRLAFTMKVTMVVFLCFGFEKNLIWAMFKELHIPGFKITHFDLVFFCFFCFSCFGMREI